MDNVIIANITSFIGMSAGAQHYYCRWESVDQLELLSRIHEYDTLTLHKKEDLLWYPTVEEAEKYFQDEPFRGDLTEFGTTRFRSIHQITERLRELFTGHDIVIAVDDSIKQYTSSMLHEYYYTVYDSLSEHEKSRVEMLVCGRTFEKYADWARSKEFLAPYVFARHDEYSFTKAVKSLKQQ